MATRQKKRSRKFFGTRNHGKGNTKNRRGKGGKGGWGRAGMHKHRFTYITRFERDWMAHGGRFGFHNVTKKRVPIVNLYEIEQLAASGKLEKREGFDYFEFPGKVLGTGIITKPVKILALAFSEGAAAKIKKAGGSIEAIAPTPAAKKE
ncbi:MAG: uL15 family ribosomal protein [Candidatus Micrarchaeota archaeon]|nr:uL15 family ribosomal protein [Candidatus Micrarchaeota archaeon]